MSTGDIAHDERQMQQVVQFLETMPSVRVPEDFSARVVSQLLSRQARVTRLPRLQANAGVRSLYACLAVVLCLAFAAAPHAIRGASVWQSVEWAACLQLFALIVLTGIFRRVLPR